MQDLGEERKKGSGSFVTAIIYYTCKKWNYDVNGFKASNLLSDRKKEAGV
jgi:hypothetical protein